MSQQLKRLGFAVLGLLSFAMVDSVSALAWGEVEQTCQTRSNGMEFNRRDFDSWLVRRAVIEDCVRNRLSQPGECRYFAQCELDRAGEWSRCSTQSDGITYRDGDGSEYLAMRRVLEACQQNRFSESEECHRNLVCGNRPLSPVDVPRVNPSRVTRSPLQSSTFSCRAYLPGMGPVAAQGRFEEIAKRRTVEACARLLESRPTAGVGSTRKEIYQACIERTRCVSQR